MKMPIVPKNVRNYILTIILIPALIAIINSVAGNFGYTFKPQVPENSSQSQTEELITQGNTEQNTGDDNDCPIQMSGSNGNSVNCLTDNSEDIEKQEINERKIETEQYNENNDSNPVNCNRNNGTCGDNGTTIINPGKE